MFLIVSFLMYSLIILFYISIFLLLEGGFIYSSSGGLIFLKLEDICYEKNLVSVISQKINSRLILN